MRHRPLSYQWMILLILLLSGTAWSATPQPNALEQILGPRVPLGQPEGALTTTFDSQMQTLGLSAYNAWKANHSDTIGSTYYDLPYVLYQVYYRTGQTVWRDRAREVAHFWANSHNVACIPIYLDQGDPGNACGPSMPPPRSLNIQGVAINALEEGYGPSVNAVYQLARWMHYLCVNHYCKPANMMTPPDGDPREPGWLLMANTTAYLMGHDYRTEAAAALTTILSQQQPDGSWLGYSAGNVPSSCAPPDGRFKLNFMIALLLEGMISYDWVYGDARIVPSVQKALTYLWTQWRNVNDGFQYANINCGTIGAYPANDLTGMFLMPWGYTYQKTASAGVLTQWNLVYQALVNGLQGLPGDPKHVDQAYRSSIRALGWFAMTTGSPDTLAPSPPTHLTVMP
jgi:hypothetical protein